MEPGHNTKISCKRRINEGARSAPLARRLSASSCCSAARGGSLGRFRQAKLLADEPAKGVADLSVARHRSAASCTQVPIEIMASAVSHEDAPRLGEFTDELTALQTLDLDGSRLDRDPLRRRIGLRHQAVRVFDVLFEFGEVLALAHDARYFHQTADQPPVILPVLEGEGPHGQSMAPVGVV